MAGLTCCPYLAHGMSFTISEPKVSHIGHSNHLCDMAEKGQISLEQMKALTKDPQFICKKCGRVAHSADNLCEPVPL
jgi:hypothetical protein